MTGTVVNGMGKAAGFVRSYTPLFEKELGITPFPGTLNVVVEHAPSLHDGITITPPQGSGQVACFNVIVNDKVRGFLIRPIKTTHPPELLELIAPVNLKEYFSLRDGEKVHLRFP